ncbi:MAG: HDIG domain-containing metalloprotein, partial [Gemmatimonadota bacterium]
MSRKRKQPKGAPVFLQTLSNPPDGSWPQGTFYHGTRIGLLVLLAVAITLLFPSDPGQSVARYQVGDVAREDLAAEIGFAIPKDSVELERQRAEAEAAVPPVFLYDAETQGRIEADLNGFFDRIQEAVEAGGRPVVEEVLREENLPSLVEKAESFLDPTDLRALRRNSLELVRQFADRVLDSDYDGSVQSAGQIHIWANGVDEGHLDSSELLWGTDFFTAAIGALGPSTSEFQSNVRLLLIHFFDSPYTLDVSRTETRRLEARSVVPTTQGSVVEGEYIVRRGDQIGPSELQRLAGHQIALQSQGRIREMGRDWSSLMGKFLLNLLILGVFGFLLFFYRREVYGSFRWVLLLAFLVFVYFLMAAGISWQGYPSELLPIAFVVLPVAILWDGRMALILALVLAVLSGAQEPFNSYPILAFTLLGGAAAALSARAIRRRAQTWIFIALITLGYALAATAFGLMGDGTAPGGVFVSILFGGLNATVSAILAMGFMPVFEWFTGITTDQTLLEWADPNRPLLKSLSLEASGTYAHTISVANLAEAAATAIGANGLLARVGVYYHDVGKMLKPQYFVENQPGGRNPHDKLKPHTSAAIVREHVIEGERMARDEGVPDVVARFIPEHHGTQLIGFFYEKAKEESGEEPNQDEFRYPGPKPRSKETAIAMLADSVESATRALHDASPERVDELVRTIVDGKIRDGQLSESPLTLREITLIQEQFV